MIVGYLPIVKMFLDITKNASLHPVQKPEPCMAVYRSNMS